MDWTKHIFQKKTINQWIVNLVEELFEELTNKNKIYYRLQQIVKLTEERDKAFQERTSFHV